MSWLSKAVDRATGAIGKALGSNVREKLGETFDKNPLLFGHLPGPIKKAIFDLDKSAAVDAAEQAGDLAQAKSLLTAEADGLRQQLAAVRTQQGTYFRSTDSRSVAHYMRAENG
jgi:hypothetical protein